MIATTTYTLDWITALRNKLGRRVDPKMIEKVIKALVLLEQLRTNEIDLIFKGGTSLLLTSKNPNRFSIDIDIITKQNDVDIKAALDKIVANAPFTRWEADNDRKKSSLFKNFSRLNK